MNDELVHLGVAGGVATVTLDSPANRNALSRQLSNELAQKLDAAIADERARVIVLTGTGPAFCAGADLTEQRAGNEAGTAQAPPLDVLLTAIWNAPKPVVGRINGPARAGGLGLVAACDIAVAEESTTFAVTEVRLGLAPAMVSVVLLPKLGLGRALELFLTGDPFDARAAAAWGLLTAAAPDGDLDAVVGGYIESLLKGGPRALAATKRIVREVPSLSMAEAFARMAPLSTEFFASAEGLEGMRAYAERRPPRWAVEE
jgi:methylglutaconyl-CoA hydratase